MNTKVKIGYLWGLMITLLVVITGCNVTGNKQSDTRPVNVYMQTKTTSKGYSNPYGLSSFYYGSSGFISEIDPGSVVC